MAVNRANVAITDTFDTWRNRTNELNFTLNSATDAATGNTVIFRDDDASFSGNVASLVTLNIDSADYQDVALTVTTSTLSANDTHGSIRTDGGLLAKQNSQFSADLVVKGSVDIGLSAAQTITFNASVDSHIIPNANLSHDLGSTDKYFDNIYAENLTLAPTGTIALTTDTTTADAITINATDITSGTILDINSGGTSTGNLVSIVSTQTASTVTGTGLYVKMDTTNADAHIAKFANSSNDIMSVDVGGTVTIKNLNVTGTTTEFNNTQTLVRDKTLVLGAQSEVVQDASFSYNTTTISFDVPDNLTTQSLNVADIIFVTQATNDVGTAITSETLYKIASITDNGSTLTITITDLEDANLGSSGDEGTLSFVGAQTDLAVDGAGIYVPGSTEVHKITWDDTTNYWEVNDSFRVNATTQLLFPKGTTVERPSSNPSLTVAGATPGAMRFNTDDGIFEGVHDQTTNEFEGMSTQSYATAIAIALGS